jgi:hypothetical protein
MMHTQMTQQERQAMRNEAGQQAFVQCLVCPPSSTPQELAAMQIAFALTDAAGYNENAVFAGLGHESVDSLNRFGFPE